MSSSENLARHQLGIARHRRARGAPTDAHQGRANRPKRSARWSFTARLRYWFDGALSRGPSVVIGWLGVLTLGIVVVSSLVIAVFRISGINGGDSLGLGEALWQSLLRVVDAGTFAADTGWGTRLLGLAVTLAGIFVAGSLIGLIASAVDQQIEMLRKGRSAVLEHDHTLILGWSDRVPAVVRELVEANRSRRRAAVVILAGVDKTEMEDVLRSQVDDLCTTRLVCRQGDMSVAADLERVNILGARSIIVIGRNDAAVVKALLAIGAFQSEGTTLAPVVAEICDPQIASSVRSLFGSGVAIVNSDSVVAELTAQACRQRGLGQVFRELLDFDGDEIYFAPFPSLVGETYGRAQLTFPTSCLIGVLTASGELMLNPAADRVIAEGDELVGIASDDSEFMPGEYQPSRVTLDPEVVTSDPFRRRLVVVGWSQLGPRVLRELDEFLDSDTTIEIIVDPRLVDLDSLRESAVASNVHVEVSGHEGGPEELALHAARTAFHEVIVLGRRDGVDAEYADATTLLTLVAFSRAAAAQDLGPVRIVAELLEQRHAPLAVATGVDDFIVSDELTSLMMAQLSERHELDGLFRDLFDREGATVEVVPADRYGAAQAGCFADIVAAASRAGHSAIGYRREHDGSVVVNPSKQERLTLSSADGVVVLRS